MHNVVWGCAKILPIWAQNLIPQMKKMYIYVYIKQSRRKELTTIKRFGLSIEGVTLILTVKNLQLGLRKQRRPGF